ncbi:MAG: transcriptional regulator [Lachnospiraceae bacterium]|nr:transcriptional regulator [Lachnospiraceae bacterium]
MPLISLLREYPEFEQRIRVPEKIFPLRLWYMFQNQVCTIIDVDERVRKVKVYNFTNDLLKRAFGREEEPSFERYEDFLESRCFPAGRDKMKILLEHLGLPFYDPILIIEKTQGRMEEDFFWIRIER